MHILYTLQGSAGNRIGDDEANVSHNDAAKDASKDASKMDFRNQMKP